MTPMRLLLKAVAAALVAVAQPVPAAPVHDAQRAQHYAQFQRPRPEGVQRQPERDFRRAEQPPDRDPRRDGKLTEEERRGLRRDIDRANREIYKGRQ